MTDVIYERAGAREATIWGAFQFNGPFSTLHEEERTALFGLYANTYLHGQNYLSEIETEDLARLVDTYTNNMAMLTNEEAQTVLEIAAKRYVENITQQLHDAGMITRGKKIDALDAEYDARDDALDADREALITKRAEVNLAWDRANQKIKELEARRKLEEVNQGLVDVEITEQELKAARADLEKLTAVLKGLDIQLAITQTGIEKINTNLQITEAENEVDEVNVRASETKARETGVDLDITNAGISLSKSEAEGERIKARTKDVGVRSAETEVQITETEAKENQLTADIARIEADTAKLELVDSEKTIAQSDVSIARAENELIVQEKYLIDSRKDNVTNETGFVETHQTTQEELDAKQLEHDQTEHDATVNNIQAENDFEDNLNEIKVNALDQRKDLADRVKATKVEDATDRTEIDDIKADAAEEYAAAAVLAAQEMANANIMNTLTHSVG